MPKPDPKLSIKSPCPKIWGELVGDDTKRFCSQCEKHVYNGESLTRVEVKDLVREGQGNTCMRLITDEAGSILYKDSPKKIKPSSIVRRAGLAIAAGGLVAACSSQPEQTPPPEVKPIAGSEQAGMPIQGTVELEPIEVLEEELGEICEEVMGFEDMKKPSPSTQLSWTTPKATKCSAASKCSKAPSITPTRPSPTPTLKPVTSPPPPANSWAPRVRRPRPRRPTTDSTQKTSDPPHPIGTRCIAICMLRVPAV